MFNKFKRNKAQTTLEYAILIGVIVAGLIAMQVYLKRGYQGKLRESADSMGQQFSPGYTTGHYTTTSSTESSEVLKDKQTVSTIPTDGQTSDKTTSESVATSDQEFWWK
ncbi:MAG: hypothetical protein PHT50_02520 [Candidatus Omnitrophica bacterium]|nr:hypothetical protein [Candidatus Omnitrophota bacterium]